MKKYLVIVFFLSIYNVYGQNDTTATLLIVAGGGTDFSFNSYKKLQDGFAFNNWTRLKPRFIVTVASVVNPTATVPWSLSVRANAADIQGDGGNSLALGTVRVMVPAPLGDGNWKPLTDSDTEIATGTYDPAAGEIIEISYDCGVATTVMGEQTDYYFVDLVFTLQSTNL